MTRLAGISPKIFYEPQPIVFASVSDPDSEALWIRIQGIKKRSKMFTQNNIYFLQHYTSIFQLSHLMIKW